MRWFALVTHGQDGREEYGQRTTMQNDGVERRRLMLTAGKEQQVAADDAAQVEIRTRGRSMIS